MKLTKLTKLEAHRLSIGVPVIAGPRKPIPKLPRVPKTVCKGATK